MTQTLFFVLGAGYALIGITIRWGVLMQALKLRELDLKELAALQTLCALAGVFWPLTLLYGLALLFKDSVKVST